MSIQNIIFRKATPADVEDLVRLRMAFLKEVQKPETRQLDDATLETALRMYFQRSVENDEFVAWLALHEGKIVATSHLYRYIIAY
jgi:hypothetical protein